MYQGYMIQVGSKKRKKVEALKEPMIKEQKSM
jgi:hypothetical protein